MEVVKGNHSYEIASLFPANIEYQKLLDFFQTPLNNNTQLTEQLPLPDTFCIFIFYFLIRYIKNKKQSLQTINCCWRH